MLIPAKNCVVDLSDRKYRKKFRKSPFSLILLEILLHCYAKKFYLALLKNLYKESIKI